MISLRQVLSLAKYDRAKYYVLGSSERLHMLITHVDNSVLRALLSCREPSGASKDARDDEKNPPTGWAGILHKGRSYWISIICRTNRNPWDRLPGRVLVSKDDALKQRGDQDRVLPRFCHRCYRSLCDDVETQEAAEQFIRHNTKHLPPRCTPRGYSIVSNPYPSVPLASLFTLCL